MKPDPDLQHRTDLAAEALRRRAGETEEREVGAIIAHTDKKGRHCLPFALTQSKRPTHCP